MPHKMSIKVLFISSILLINLTLGCSSIDKDKEQEVEMTIQSDTLEQHNKENNEEYDNTKKKNVLNNEELNDDNKFEPIFTKNPIDESIRKRIEGISWKEDCPVNLEQLSYLNITYWGFDDEIHIGEMIVHSEVAEEVIDIFKELYNNKFPIEKMNLVDEYGADDNKSMADNNTSAFCYRKISGSNSISRHGYGLAIDINPLINPYIKGKVILPKEGKKFLNRDKSQKGIIYKDNICYNAFIDRGWTWGGDWKSPKDYQHFEKYLTVEKSE